MGFVERGCLVRTGDGIHGFKYDLQRMVMATLGRKHELVVRSLARQCFSLDVQNTSWTDLNMLEMFVDPQGSNEKGDTNRRTESNQEST